MIPKEQFQAARKANLAAFLLSKYPDDFKREGQSIRPKFNPSISIKNGIGGYTDFSTGETGNGIDFLMNYYDYSFKDAVEALTGPFVSDIPSSSSASVSSSASAVSAQPEAKLDGMAIPEAADDNRRVIAYLTQKRGIKKDTVLSLIHSGLLYQDTHGNCVFINPESDWAELRGTGDTPFHGIPSGARSDGYWYFIPDPSKPNPVYICESAIDAVSLYELYRQNTPDTAFGVFVSIGGAGKQQAIDRLSQRKNRHLIIATDADAAGDDTRSRNPRINTIRPGGTFGKDWNEIWLKVKK